MQRAFAHFDRLGLIGGCIYVGDKLVAFTYGSPINDHTFCVHVEKADTEYDGAFTIINREFVAHLPEQYTLIDREEDLGIPGLRQAKLSYHPAFLEKKYTALCLYPDEIACKRLWIKCFEDEETFIDSFLIGHYSRKRMLAAEEDGRLAAMLHLIPFESELGRTTYIYGVATDPGLPGPGPGLRIDARGNAADRRRRADAAILIPSQESLKDFYAPFGFEDRSLPVVFEAPDDFDFGSATRNRIGPWSGAATTAHRCPNVCTADFSDPAKNRSAESTADASRRPAVLFQVLPNTRFRAIGSEDSTLSEKK